MGVSADFRLALLIIYLTIILSFCIFISLVRDMPKPSDYQHEQHSPKPPEQAILPLANNTSLLWNQTSDGPAYQDIDGPVSSEPPKSIYIDQEIVETLDARFASDNKEFEYCLFGRDYLDGLLIIDTFEPEYINRTEEFVRTEGCPSNSVGYIHSHPGESNCMLSEGEDKDTGNLLASEFPISGVICGIKQYAFYNKLDVKKMLKIYAITAGNATEITMATPCPGDRFCEGECWQACDAYYVFHCTENGTSCDPSPGVCPPGQFLCNGACTQGCENHFVFICTAEGPRCELDPDNCPPQFFSCNGQCWQRCVGIIKCTPQGAQCD